MSAIAMGACSGPGPPMEISPRSPGSIALSLPSHSASKSSFFSPSSLAGGGGGGGAPRPLLARVEANARDQTTCSAQVTCSRVTAAARAPPPWRSLACNPLICSRCS